MRLLPVFYLLSLTVLYGQNIEVPVNHRVVINHIDHVIYADILSTDQEVDPDNDLYYYWFKASDIKKTRGGFDGTLLHGSYIEFYPDKNLKEKGTFRYGLKHGVWKTWYQNGELESIIRWKKGKMFGDFRLFSKEGQLVQEGCYRNDQLHGRFTTYLNQGEPEVCRYEKGKKVAPGNLIRSAFNSLKRKIAGGNKKAKDRPKKEKRRSKRDQEEPVDNTEAPDNGPQPIPGATNDPNE